MTSIINKRLSPEIFVYQSLTKEAYLRTYNFMIHPIPDQSIWLTVKCDILLSPLKKCMPERPKLSRKREVDEQATHKKSSTLDVDCAKDMDMIRGLATRLRKQECQM